MIFKKNAPLYWAVGLPAIPLLPEQKRPAVNRWQMFADKQPTSEEKAVWLEHFPDGNIGMPMGAASGLVAIDIDTDDEAVIAALEKILPPSPWRRVGKKGMVKIYRFNGERTTRIKSDAGMICEILSKGTQIVLPPSIHPDTKQPYTSDTNLYEVMGKLPTLPMNIDELIRNALELLGIEVSVGGGNNKITTFVPAGARDNTMVWHAGLLARAVVRGERTLIEALGEMAAWVEGFVEKVIGDPLTIEKAQAKLVEFLVRDVTGERGQGLPPGWDDGLTAEDKDKLGLTFTQDHEQWEADRILQFLAQEFERHADPNSAGRMSAIQIGLDKVAKAGSSLSVLDEERILRFIQGQSANTLTVASLKKQMTSLRRGDIAGESHDEVAGAVLEYVSNYGELRFDAGSFWQWKGAYWAQKDGAELLKIIAQEFGNYPACKRHSDYQGVLKTMMVSAAKDLVQVSIKGINFANGFLTEDQKLIEHHPDHGMTYILPFRYLPELAGHMPMFNQYLIDSWGEDADFSDKVAGLQEAMGATMFGVAPRYQRAICCFGVAGSGKSRVTSIMQGLLPAESVSSIAPHDWGDRFMPAEMFGRVMNFAGELSESKSIPGDIFKQIIEGEGISAQYKNLSPFRFKPMCAQWFNSNFLPRTKDTSDGFNRRWLILEWNKRVDPKKKIVDLDRQILDHEREAIAAWAVQGFIRLQKNGDYTLPASHLACVDQMSYDNNSVRYFLAQCPRIVVGRAKTEELKDNAVTATALHGEYWSFCLGIGIVARVSLQKFQGMMKDLQQSFEFEARTKDNIMGSPEVIYQWVALAGKGA